MGLVRGYGDFMSAYDFIHPSPIDDSKYSEPTISAQELAQMRNGIGALVVCAIGVLSLLTAGAHFLKELTAPVVEERETQTDGLSL